MPHGSEPEELQGMLRDFSQVRKETYERNQRKEKQTMLNQSFIVVHRKLDGYEKIYAVGSDLNKAICMQKALIASDSVPEELLAVIGKTISSAEAQQIIDNLAKFGYDRMCNDEEEAYIFFMPGKERMR